ncbi:alpha/beta hydrolase family protein [Thalassotalea sp. PS06]|uniref:alpha/beta hydrolase family protein n=1 Tax=Thalassotalea sp. PS06 TaxID=2594005 RepID=UPI0011644ACB|nr:S9 family peptidase [Thalassotalea sp. PS06]QDP01154.1 S9 family peptidase [Thalassotalea sp. PS06]
MKNIILSIFLILFSHNILASNLEKYTRQFQNEQVKISPDGKYLAVRTKHEGQNILAIIETNNRKVINTINFSGKKSVGEYHWINNKRLVVRVLSDQGVSIKQTYNTGRLFAINYDGSKKVTLGHKESRYLEIVSTLKGDDNHILIAAHQSRHANQEKRHAVVCKVNIDEKWQWRAWKCIMQSPGRGGKIIVDNNSEIRFSVGEVGFDEYIIYYREPEGEWQKFNPEFDYSKINIEGFSEDNNSVYIIVYNDGDTGTLYSYDLIKRKANKIYHNEFVEITYLLKNYQGIPFGFRIDEDYPKYLIFDETAEHSRLYQDLYRAFQGNSVDIINSTADGKLLIVVTSSDRNPGKYYLYNKETKQAQFLLSKADWLKPSELATVEPFKFTTRDQILLNGYLTLPNNKADENLPLVVMPHGGPRIRDFWNFNPFAQQLAASGYAVLQVNFRGSSGFGEKILHMGDKNWGSKVQYDIIDATEWAIKSGVADPERICIYGGSFGAYSALQSSTIEPDMFKCTIGVSGVYDLIKMRDDGDIPDSLWGGDYLDEVLGNDVDTLKLNSPVNHVDKLNAPVLLIHGSADKRIPMDQTERLEEALKEKGHSVKTLYIDNEYHGFVKQENRLKASIAVVEFLNEHIGK